MGSSRTAQQAHRDAINLERMLVRLEQATSSSPNKQQQASTRPSHPDYDYYKTLSTLSSIRNAKRMLEDDTVHDQQERHALDARLDKLRAHYQGVLETVPKPKSDKHLPNLEHLRPKEPVAATTQAPSQRTPLQERTASGVPNGERTQVNPELTDEETRRAAAEDNLLSLGGEADEESGGSNLRRRSSAGPSAGGSGLQPLSDLDEGTLSNGSSELPPATSTSRSTGASNTAPNPAPSSTQSLSNLLSHHRSEQESLTEELAQMAGRLKMNSLEFAQLLEKDKTLLQNADEKLEGNLGGMIKERDRLKEYKKTGGVTLWFIIGSVGAVMAAWLFMFALMRIF